jgi:hypothetical protein
MPKKIANKPTAKRGNPNWKKGGASPNPAGAPKRGESWAEIIKRVGALTPKEAAAHCQAIAGQLASIGDGVTMKEAVVMRVYAALMFEPQPGLFNAFMDRTEGKVSQTLELRDWRAEAAEAGIDADALTEELFAKVLPHD